MISNIITEPIKVICKKTNGSLKLMKGCEYEATLLCSTNWGRRSLQIKNVGFYDANNFILNDGKPVTDLNDFSVKENKQLDCSLNNYTNCQNPKNAIGAK